MAPTKKSTREKLEKIRASIQDITAQLAAVEQAISASEALPPQQTADAGLTGGRPELAVGLDVKAVDAVIHAYDQGRKGDGDNLRDRRRARRPSLAVIPDAFRIVTNALQRNHGINPADVQIFHQLRATFGLNEMEIRALDVPINDQLPAGTFVTPDECQACITIGNMTILVDEKL